MLIESEIRDQKKEEKNQSKLVDYAKRTIKLD